MEKTSRKVGWGAGAGCVTVILVWAIKAFGHVEVPAEISSALTTLLTLSTSYFITEPE